MLQIGTSIAQILQHLHCPGIVHLYLPAFRSRINFKHITTCVNVFGASVDQWTPLAARYSYKWLWRRMVHDGVLGVCYALGVCVRVAGVAHVGCAHRVNMIQAIGIEKASHHVCVQAMQGILLVRGRAVLI